MKKKVILALSFLLISFAFVYDNHSTQSNDTALKNAHIKIEESNFLDTTKANNTEAFYLDYEDTLEDIKNSADLIVVGRVIKQSE